MLWRWGSALVGAGALALPAACGTTDEHSGSSSAIPPRLLAQARPIGSGPRFHPPAKGPLIGPCRRRLGRREGVHVEVFGDDRVVIVPAGIGTRPPRRVSAGRIVSAGCYGSLVTVEPTGLVLVRPDSRMLLSDLFRAWGVPLSIRRVASFKAPPGGRVAVFVNGRRWRGEPGAVPLSRHAEVVLELGPFVPPHSSYAFPAGL